MQTISVTVDEDTHRQLRIMAAEQGTSVSAMIRDQMVRLLTDLAQGTVAETEPERRRRELDELIKEFQEQGIGISMKDNQTREEMYQHRAPR